MYFFTLIQSITLVSDLLLFGCALSHSNEHRYYIVGDGAYPLGPTLVMPYEFNASLTDDQNLFNNDQSATRMPVERFFGVLTARWRILRNTLNYRPTIAKQIISSCVVLHNICILHGEDFDTSLYEESECPSNVHIGRNIPHATSRSNAAVRAAGKVQRDLLCEIAAATRE